MLSKNAATLTVDTALLSAINTGREQGHGGSALLQVVGAPLLTFQIQQLVAAGIRKFLVEVDVVSGAIAAVADQMKQRGISVEFVRFPKDLQDCLGAGELLFVMSEGVIANDDLLAEMIAQPLVYIVTVDGRKENEIFERIDLNSFWAGLALFDHRSIAAIASLPEGWNIGSSLLRQALQDSIVHRPLSQDLITSKLFRRVLHQDDANDLTKKMLTHRAHDADGFMEAKLFGPVAAKLAPLFWNAPTPRQMLGIGSMLTAAAAAEFATIGAAALAMAALLAALFLIKLQDMIGDRDRRGPLMRLFGGVIWAGFAVTIFLISWGAGRGSFSALFAPMVMLALMLYAVKSRLTPRQKALIASPALATILLLFAAFFNVWMMGLCLVAIAQLFVLLWPLYAPDLETVKLKLKLTEKS